jgi:hypothetical protein
MLTLLAILACAGDNEQDTRPKPPAPVVIPIPTGVTPWDYRLSTGWSPMTRALPRWRMGKRHDDGRWEESVIGQRGGRVREIIVETESFRTFATSGRNSAGSGGVGEGFAWSAFVGGSWTADLDVEFTSNGPRIVVGLAYYPFDGVAHRYGWSVLSGQLLHGVDWSFTEDDLCSIYYTPRFAALMTFYQFWRGLGLDREE